MRRGKNKHVFMQESRIQPTQGKGGSQGSSSRNQHSILKSNKST